jgi:hypothetical protein
MSLLRCNNKAKGGKGACMLQDHNAALRGTEPKPQNCSFPVSTFDTETQVDLSNHTGSQAIM